MNEINLLNDIYYQKEYAELYLKEKEEVFWFEYFEKDNFFVNLSIKRPILKIGNIKLNEIYYDLETPYGYGGFYTNSEDINFIKTALRRYEERCKKDNIIAEFFRFHPFNIFPEKYENFLEFCIYDRDVVVVKLEQEILSSYSSKVRNIVKKAIRNIKINQSKNIEKFKEIYEFTMTKNRADNFYFFSLNYFKKLLNLKNVELYEAIYNNETIAMAFFMFGDKVAHYHLSANTSMSYKVNGNYALLHSMFETAKKRGYKYFLLGGGTTSSKEDSLLKFKKKFSKITKPFYIGGKIYNNEIYKKYCDLWQQQSNKNIQYFLKYRLGVENE